MAEDMDKVFRALADRSRRQLLDRLHADNGQTLGRLCALMDMSRQAVAKHLSTLDDAGLVERAPGSGREVLYRLRPGALDAATRSALSTNNEYDFTLDYLFANSAVDWPKWLRPLWIRGRAALVDQYQSGALTTIRDYRVILNYEWKFGGKEH